MSAAEGWPCRITPSEVTGWVAALAKRKVELLCSWQTKASFEWGSTEQQGMAYKQVRRRQNILNSLQCIKVVPPLMLLR